MMIKPSKREERFVLRALVEQDLSELLRNFWKLTLGKIDSSINDVTHIFRLPTPSVAPKSLFNI